MCKRKREMADGKKLSKFLQDFLNVKGAPHILSNKRAMTGGSEEEHSIRFCGLINSISLNQSLDGVVSNDLIMVG